MSVKIARTNLFLAAAVFLLATAIPEGVVLQRFKPPWGASELSSQQEPSPLQQQCPGANDEPLSSDVVVYGGTAGGVVAAVAAARMNCSVIVLNPTKHLVSVLHAACF